MTIDYIKTLCETLLLNHHTISFPHKNAEIDEDTSNIIFIRANNPMLYIVNIVNFENNEHAKSMDLSHEHLTSLLQNTYCSNCIYITLIVDDKEENKDFLENYVNGKPFFPNEIFNEIYWYSNPKEKTIYFGKEQPTDIFKYRQWFESSFNNTSAFEGNNLNEIANHCNNQRKNVLKSDNFYLTLSLIAINLMIFSFVMANNLYFEAVNLFANNSILVIKEHEFYRLLTSMFFHASISHVVYNCLSLYIFGSILEKHLGKFKLLSIYFLGGIIASIFSVIFTQSISLGASGGVFALVGAIASYTKKNNSPVNGLNYITILIFLVMGVGLGLQESNIDNWAHIGGFIGGFIIQQGVVHKRVKNKEKN